MLTTAASAGVLARRTHLHDVGTSNARQQRRMRSLRSRIRYLQLAFHLLQLALHSGIDAGRPRHEDDGTRLCEVDRIFIRILQRHS